jgi:hypothetical protein
MIGRKRPDTSGHHKMGQAEFLNVVSAAVIEFFFRFPSACPICGISIGSRM